MTVSLGQTVLYSLITPVRLVSTSNVAGSYYNGPSNNGVGATLTVAASSLTIDSVVVAVGDRLLLQNQTSSYQNGIYIVKAIASTVILQRSDDMQSIEQLKAGQFTTVGAGTVNQGAAFALVEPLPQAIGVDDFLWVATSVNSGGLSNTLADGNIFVGNASNVATGVTPSGDITLSNAGVFGIAAGAIVNADINAAAAIAFSKLATLASANILVGSAGGVATSVAVTGDVTISNAGVTAIGAGVIVNADVSASAAIAFSKLATLTSGNLLVGSAGGVPTSVAMSGDATIVASGALTIANDAITTAKILNANVTLAKLSAGITPSHVIKFANQVTTVGGAAAEAFTVTGAVAATDRAFVQVVNDGTANVTVLQAVVTNDTLTVTFSANPGADTVINYQIIRAAA